MAWFTILLLSLKGVQWRSREMMATTMGIPVVGEEKSCGIVPIVTFVLSVIWINLLMMWWPRTTSEQLISKPIFCSCAFWRDKIESTYDRRENRLVGLITYKDITKSQDKPMACKDERSSSCCCYWWCDCWYNGTLERVAAGIWYRYWYAHGHSAGVVGNFMMKTAFLTLMLWVTLRWWAALKT